MKIPTAKIKSKLKYLAKEFDIKYNSKWFNFILVSKQDKYLGDFVFGCPDPDYNKFGKTSEVRIKNLDRFLNSKIYVQEIRKPSGCVKLKKDTVGELKLIKLIKNKDVKDKLSAINKKVKVSRLDIVALITKPETKRELKIILYILLHEWEHILLIKNNIHFQKRNKKYWVLDEGLVTYFDAYINRETNKIENRAKRIKRRMSKIYFTNAMIFKKLLADKHTSKERKKVILNYYENLPKTKIITSAFL